MHRTSKKTKSQMRIDARMKELVARIEEVQQKVDLLKTQILAGTANNTGYENELSQSFRVLNSLKNEKNSLQFAKKRTKSKSRTQSRKNANRKVKVSEKRLTRINGENPDRIIIGSKNSTAKKINLKNIETQKKAVVEKQRTASEVKYQYLLGVISQSFASEEMLIGLQNLSDKRRLVSRLISSKWSELESADREFGLSKTEEYPVLLSIKFLKKIGIVSFTYSSRGLIFPTVNVEIEFGSKIRIPVRLEKGQLTSIPSALRTGAGESGILFLTLAILLHYIDLLITQNPNGGRTISSKQKSMRSPKSSTDTTQRRVRDIPRRKSSSKKNTNDEQRNITYASRVGAFRRKLPKGSAPSLQKILEADRYGIVLEGPGYPKVKYTWVAPHTRGDESHVPTYEYRDYSAARMFETVLDALGFCS